MTTDEAVPALTGYRTTFHNMFSTNDPSNAAVLKVEIPLIQRDYAQGREDARTDALAQLLRLDEGRAALAEGDDGGSVEHRQTLGVLGDDAAPQVGHVRFLPRAAPTSRS